MSSIFHPRTSFFTPVATRLTSAARFFESRAGKLVFVLVSIGLLLARRPSQFQNPTLWVEEVSRNLPEVATGEILAVFDPMNGYLIVIPRLFTWVGLQVGLERLPQTSLFLAVAFSVFCLYTIAYSATVLRAPRVCAFFVLLIPIASEPYASALYTLWFAGLLLFVVVLWIPSDVSRSSLVKRVALLLLGGLSSPLMPLLLPLMAFRLWLWRTWQELSVLVVGTVIAGVQLVFIAGEKAVGSVETTWSLAETIRRFVLWFAARNTAPPSWILTGAAATIAVATIYYALLRGRLFLPRTHWLPYALFGLFGLTVAASCMRVSVGIMHPLWAGPRYFFYPYTILSWSCIAILCTSAGWLLPTLAGAALIAAVLQVPRDTHKPTSTIRWSDYVAACRWIGTGLSFPAQYDGKGTIWWGKLSSDRCRDLARSPNVRLWTIVSQPGRRQSDGLTLISDENGWSLKSVNEVAGAADSDRLISSNGPTGPKGALRIHVTTGDRSPIYLTYLSGSSTDHQMVEVREWLSGRVMARAPILPAVNEPATIVVVPGIEPLFAGNLEIRLLDEGTGTDEWIALVLSRDAGSVFR